MLYSWERNKFKIMYLQARRRYPRFIIGIYGDLLQKRAKNAAQISVALRKQFVDKVNQLGWKCVPRAAVAVTMHFYPNNEQYPSLHKLVKYYLDLLGGIVFTDDRQVAYLAVQCWHNPGRAVRSKNTPTLYIHVERLRDYKINFDLMVELSHLDGFDDFFKEKHGHKPFGGWEDDIDEILENELEREIFGTTAWDTISKFFPPEKRERILAFSRAEYQKKFLKLNRIDSYDRPGGVKHEILQSALKQWRTIAPFAISLGNLPERGETKQYKHRIRHQLQQMRRNSPIKQVIVPLEVDVQVTSDCLIPGKDLDNIMIDVAPSIQNELLSEKAYLRGYRIYVTNTLLGDSGNISIKLLPEGAIQSFENEMTETLSIAKEWFQDQIES